MLGRVIERHGNEEAVMEQGLLLVVVVTSRVTSSRRIGRHAVDWNVRRRATESMGEN